MKTLQHRFVISGIFLLYLVLPGSSSSLFAAIPGCTNSSDVEAQQELVSTSFLTEQVTDLFDSILLSHRNVLSGKESPGSAVCLEAHLLKHSSTSRNYFKRSRDIFPGLGVREIIFPFHIFL